MSLEDKADNKLALNILGWLSHHEQNPPRLNKEIEYKLHDAWVCAGRLKYFNENRNWVSAPTFGHPMVDFGPLADLIRYARSDLSRNWRGVLNEELPLPAATHFFLNDAWTYKGDLWTITSEGWVKVASPALMRVEKSAQELMDISLKIIQDTQIEILGEWKGKILPAVGRFEVLQALFWRDTLFVVRHREGEGRYWDPLFMPRDVFEGMGKSVITLDDQDDNIPLNILGFLVGSEQIPPVFKKPFGYVEYDAWVKDGKTQYVYTGLWVEYEGDVGVSCNFADYEDLIQYSREVLLANFRGVLSATRVLPPPSTFETLDCWLHGGKMWVVDFKGKWVRVTIPEIKEGEELVLKEVGEYDGNKELPSAWDFSPGEGLYWRGNWWMVNHHKTWEEYRAKGTIHMLGPHPSDQELPDANNYELNDAFTWRQGLWLNNPKGTWFNPELRGPSNPEPAMDKLFSDMVDIFERNDEPLFNILGRVSGFPIPKGDYSLRDAFIVTQDYSEELWAWSDDGEGKRGWFQVDPKHAQRIIVAHDQRQSLLSHKHTGVTNGDVTTWPFDDGMDKGSMARQIMEQKAELKRLKLSRLINKLLMWFVFLGVLGALGFAAYGYIQRDLKSGFDTTFRECEIAVGELKITGKRTYSYPYKALWGQRWVDETRVRESTTINLPGVKLAIVADAEPKWWGLRFSDGERGAPILKPALKYTLVTDKGIAMMSYGGFCKPANALPVADDSKSPERTIIN